MSMSEKFKYNQDKFVCTLTDGTTSLVVDVAADSSPLLAHGSHTVNKFNSQNIKANGIVKDGTYEAGSLSGTFLQTEFETIESWWKEAKKLTYTVAYTDSSTGAPTFTTKTYSDCIVRVSSTPTISPGKDDYLTLTLEIQCLANIAGTGSN